MNYGKYFQYFCDMVCSVRSVFVCVVVCIIMQVYKCITSLHKYLMLIIANFNYTSVSRIGSAGLKITKINNKYLIITLIKSS